MVEQGNDTRGIWLDGSIRDEGQRRKTPPDGGLLSRGRRVWLHRYIQAPTTARAMLQLQEIGHKSFDCTNAQGCATCAGGGTATANAPRPSQNGFRVVVRTKRSAETAEDSIHHNKSRTFYITQLYVGIQREIHDSLMNDEKLQDMAFLAIQEPHARRIRGRLLTTSMGLRRIVRDVRRDTGTVCGGGNWGRPQLP